MLLKKIEIFGFKSFADKTEIHFEKGITCVVGPNGCGKSNISDAIRWVLGERSAKLLRGSRMEDVVFNGTQFRKPLGMAEVSLTIDNSDKRLPIGFDEVVLTRRLYRSGESEYLINKTLCRYKDIQDLILDTGVGSTSYSMIEQGRIDYILSAQEDERRFLIEEAAGISKYKVKKEEALRKMERTEANLLRLNDIVSEVEKNIRYAERQAKRAEKYKEKLEELKRREIQMALIEIGVLQSEREQLNQELEGLSTRSRVLEAKIQDGESAFRRVDAELLRVEDEHGAFEEQRYEAKLRMSQLEERMRLNGEKACELERSTEVLKRECEMSEARLRGLQEEHGEKEREWTQLKEELEGMRATFEQLTAEYHLAREETARQEFEVKEYQSRAFEAAREMADARNQLHELDLSLQKEGFARVRSQETAARLDREKEECLKRVHELEGDPASLAAPSVKHSRLDEKKRLWEALESESRKLEALLAGKRSEVKEIQSQLELLEELEREGVFDDSAATRIVEESRKEGSVLAGMVKTLWEVIEVQAGYEGAIRAALADWAHALIVRDHEQAIKIIQYARESKLKELSLIIQAESLSGELDHRPPMIKGVRGYARDFTKVHSGYEALVEDQLRNVLVVDTLTHDRFMEWSSLANGFKIVSRDGFVLGPGLKVQYLGDLAHGNGQMPKKDRKALPERILALTSEIYSHEQEQDMLAAQRGSCGQEIDLLEKEVLMAEVDHQSTLKLQESLRDQVRRFDQELALSRVELKQALAENVGFLREKEKLESRLKRCAQDERDLQNILAQASARLNELVNRRDELFRRLSEEEKKLERLRDRDKYLADALVLLARSCEFERESDGRRRETLVANARTIHTLTEENTVHERQAGEFRERIGRLEEEARKRTAARADAVRVRGEILKSLEEKKSVLDGMREREKQIELKGMDLTYRLGGIESRIKQTYQVDVGVLDKKAFVLENVVLPVLEQEIQELKEKLESLGTVNLLAIEEHESLKQRYDFLQNQKSDLEKGREDLLEAIRKINRTTKKLFEDTFREVQTAFREYFRIMFGGGDASLVLIDESNPLESGIDIRVQPPGKRNPQLSSLSGGERALVATALLFALFKIKPSPFCVLDEVDAPLDESNIHRFLEVVSGFLGSTQFVVVTHNRKTISAADCLYGVTMEEAGVSKIVSVKLVAEGTSPNRVAGENKAGVDVVLN